MPAMNTLPSSLILAAAVAASGTLCAQDNVPADQPGSGLNFELTSSACFSGSNKLKSGGLNAGKLSSEEYNVSISGSLALGAADSLGIGASIGTIQFGHGPRLWGRAHGPLPDELNNATLDLSWTHRFDEQWASLVAISPGVRWADSKLGADAFGVSGIVGARCRQSPTLNWMIGVAFDSLSHNHSILPAAGVEWTPSEQWTLAFGFPRTAVSYHVSPALTLSLVADGKGGTYHVDKTPFRDALGVSDHLLDNSTLEYWDARVGIEADYKLSDRCSINATVGSVVYREARFHKSGIRVEKIKSDDASAYGSIGVKLAF